MNGNRVVLDTNVIILASKQQINTEILFQQYDDFYISIITYMEVYGFNFQNQQELTFIGNLFHALKIIDVDSSIADTVISYRKNKTKKIKLPDAIILATAKYLNADLITDDWDDFLGIDNDIEIVKIDNLKKN